MTCVALGAVGHGFGRGKAVLLALLPVHCSSEAPGAGSFLLCVDAGRCETLLRGGQAAPLLHESVPLCELQVAGGGHT